MINSFLKNFECSRDDDIQSFLYQKSIEYEKLSKSRTFFIIDIDELKDDIKISDITIYGYFTLALKVLTVPDDVSNRTRKDLDGISAKIHGERISNFNTYLIGQLARNSKINKEVISGKELLDNSYIAIKYAVDKVGGRIILVECKNCEKLIRFYTDNGFTVISNIYDKNVEMIQMIKMI